MNKFKPHINPVYPPNNHLIFEEWFAENYEGCDTDRELLPAFFTSYWVNNDYGNDQNAKREMQEYIDSLDRGKKWFCITQYDDSVLIDFKDLDVMRFEMSKNIGIPMPLLCQPQPYTFTGGKKWFASFVGSRTHPIRNELEKLNSKNGYLISFERMDIETYCRILHESMFALCPRGYGINSFRIAEAVQYGAIPVYISDEFINPYHTNFEVGIKIPSIEVDNIDQILSSIDIGEVVKIQDELHRWYKSFYTYQGSLEQIKKHLEIEYYSRQKG